MAEDQVKALAQLKESFRLNAQKKVVHTRMETFRSAFMQTAKTLPAQLVLALHKAVTMQVLEGVAEMTPVDTGRARNGWQVSVGETPVVSDQGEPSDFADTALLDAVTARGPAALKALRAFGISHVANNVVYLPHLEYGTSKQAPIGMIVTTVNRVASQFSK